jgi:hypothetical protein
VRGMTRVAQEWRRGSFLRKQQSLAETGAGVEREIPAFAGMTMNAREGQREVRVISGDIMIP